MLIMQSIAAIGSLARNRERIAHFRRFCFIIIFDNINYCIFVGEIEWAFGLLPGLTYPIQSAV